jgi:predicted phosphodiesterase
MLRAVRCVSPDVLIHLGDYVRDAAALGEEFQNLPLRSVSGNCDLATEIRTRLPSWDPVPVLATHGHRYFVKQGTDAL